MSLFSNWWRDKSRLCGWIGAYLGTTHSHFGVWTKTIDIILDWCNNKQPHEPWQEDWTEACWKESTKETTMSVPGMTLEVSWQHVVYIHDMCLANVAQRKNNSVNTICCMCEETDSWCGTVMGDIGLFTIHFWPNRWTVAFHFCLLCSHKLALRKTPLSICPQFY